MHQDAHHGCNPAQNCLAREWAMFEAVEAGTADGLWLTWQSRRPVIVLGRHSRVDDHVIEAACREDGIAILRRFSGGGAVVLGPGCLNYALALSFAPRPWIRDVATSFGVILGRIVGSMSTPGLTIAGSSDLALHGRKVSGTAQWRGRHALIHHGTLLYAFNPALASRYLKEPARQPEYRAGRSHADFMGHLPLAREQIMANLSVAFDVLHLQTEQLGARPTYA